MAQQAALAQVEQTLPPLQKQLAQERDLARGVDRRLSERHMPEQFVLAALRLPRDLPVSLPSHLVEQRPDVRAAEANLQSASAQIGVAIANRLPNITLTGNIGSTALAVNQLFTPGFELLDHYRRRYTADVSTAAPCCTASSRQSRLSIRRRRNIAARCIIAFQNVADSCAPSKPTPSRCRKRWRPKLRRPSSLEITRHRLRARRYQLSRLCSTRSRPISRPCSASPRPGLPASPIPSPCSSRSAAAGGTGQTQSQNRPYPLSISFVETSFEPLNRIWGPARPMNGGPRAAIGAPPPRHPPAPIFYDPPGSSPPGGSTISGPGKFAQTGQAAL